MVPSYKDIAQFALWVTIFRFSRLHTPPDEKRNQLALRSTLSISFRGVDRALPGSHLNLWLEKRKQSQPNRLRSEKRNKVGRTY
jgi:hypothetical protein